MSPNKTSFNRLFNGTLSTGESPTRNLALQAELPSVRISNLESRSCSFIATVSTFSDVCETLEFEVTYLIIEEFVRTHKIIVKFFGRRRAKRDRCFKFAYLLIYSDTMCACQSLIIHLDDGRNDFYCSPIRSPRLTFS